MALEDLACLVASKRPQNVLRILRCFYMENGGHTFTELMKRTGLREKALRYYITRLRRWRIISTQRRYLRPALYHLEPKAFHARIDTLLCDPLKHLVIFKLWQGDPLATTA